MYRFVLTFFFLLFGIETLKAQIPIGDTLTIIQRPIINIPAIVKPGDTLTIHCQTDTIDLNWSAELVFGKQKYQLKILDYKKDPSTGWWLLSVQIPDVLLFELYDLKVRSNIGESDITRDAVRVIPAERSSFYFIQITDTHLPTHKYYDDSTSVNDTSELVDLYKVIEDINLINPEFVLITGDLINEGELEELDNRRVYTTAQRMLRYFNVPVYLTSGNHDIGGWPATPEPHGTARRNWWKFFGWDILNDPPVGAPEYTQNYSFDYGNVHFTALESYDNYDEWRDYIYGNKSFTSGQLNWLQQDINRAGKDKKKVLFYHYDFKSQLDLAALDVDMALWGHTHKEIGDISIRPFDLCCDNVCDGARAYRMIKVESGELKPYNVSYTGTGDNNISVSFSPENNGANETVVATIRNEQDFSFENGLLKFNMPVYREKIFLENGVLIQVDTTGENPVYYVEFGIPAHSILNVTLSFDSIQKPTDSVIILLNEDFSSCLSTEFTIYSISGDKDWVCYKHGGNYVMKANAYQGDTASNDWLISPEINLNLTKEEYLSFMSWTRFKDNFFPPLKLLYSTDYSGSGNPEYANWDMLTFNPSEENSMKWTHSGDIDISHINEDRVFFAWQYTSTGVKTNQCAMWYVDDIEVTGKHLTGNVFTSEHVIFDIYPNPARSFCYIGLANKMQDEKFSLEIMDLSGKILTRKYITNDYQINTSGFSKGIYIIRLSNDLFSVCKKLIIQ